MSKSNQCFNEGFLGAAAFVGILLVFFIIYKGIGGFINCAIWDELREIEQERIDCVSSDLDEYNACIYNAIKKHMKRRE